MKVIYWIGLLSFCLLVACSQKERTPSDGSGSTGGGSPSGGGFATSGGTTNPCEDSFILVYNNLDSVYLRTVQLISTPSVSDTRLRTQLISLQNICLHFFSSYADSSCEADHGSSAVIIGTSDFSLVCDSANKELNQLNQKLGLHSDTITGTNDRKSNNQPQTSDLIENEESLLDAPEVIDIPESDNSLDSDLEEAPSSEETPKRRRPVPPPLIGE